MRLHHRDGTVVHLAYCTNVHPAEDLAGILGQLDVYARPIRAELETAVLGLGLWLAAPVAAQLAAEPGLRARLRGELDERGLEVVTLNGFPYEAFQAPVVKHAVYSPDWTTPERVAYTLDLARVLADLLPDGACGSISTLPLAWRDPWSAERADRSRRSLRQLERGLAEHGGRIRVALEPEPGCVVETTSQAVDLLADVDRELIGVCLDLAHLACGWEEPQEALDRLAAAGLPVVKVQVSAALQVDDPVHDGVAEYVEPRFLHQVRTGAGEAADDLPEALAAGLAGPWRVHYHVPLHAEPELPLRSTAPVLRAALDALVGGPVALSPHLEVETYTWGVLPAALRPATAQDLARGIAAELRWTRDLLTALGLKDCA